MRGMGGEECGKPRDSHVGMVENAEVIRMVEYVFCVCFHVYTFSGCPYRTDYLTNFGLI